MKEANPSHLQLPVHSLSKHQRACISLHGFLNILFGFFGGFAWIVVLGGHLHLWPIPPIEMDLPATKELWRNAHTGPITNGILALAIAGISPLLTISIKASKILVYSTIAMMWFNTIGYQTSPFTTNRGLSPVDGFLNSFCYFSFFIAVFAAFAVVIIGIMGAYRTMLSNRESN